MMAKEAGRNRVHVSVEMDGSLVNRRDQLGWAARLGTAMDSYQVKLFVREIRSLNPDLSGIHGEIMIRMEEADGTLVLPGQFLPAAERVNLVGQIDGGVLCEAIRAIKVSASLAGIIMISFNISGRSPADHAFHRTAIATLTDAGPLLCQCLTIEITETSALDNHLNALAFIAQLHGLGVDDFGAGAASFGYLRALKVGCLKIDGQFVQGLLNDPLSRATVRCFTEVAQVLGIPTVAECVDHPDIPAALLELGG